MRKNMQGAQNASDSYKILAVDDEEGIVDSLSIFLKRSGYNFTGVTDPTEAIELVRNEHFDLMILDFMMYPLHGDQLFMKFVNLIKNYIYYCLQVIRI